MHPVSHHLLLPLICLYHTVSCNVCQHVVCMCVYTHIIKCVYFGTVTAMKVTENIQPMNAADARKRGTRTNITPKQLEELVSVYEKTPRPTRDVLEQLSNSTGHR